MSAPQQPPAAPVFWVIWFALLSGMVMFVTVIGGGWPSGEGEGLSFGNPVFLAGVGMFLVSTVVRWIVLPQTKTSQSRLVAAIIGMSMMEGMLFLGMFALADSAVAAKQVLHVLAFLGIVTYLPVYAR